VRRTIAEMVAEALDAFVDEHRGCGGLTGGMWITCVWAHCRPCDVRQVVRIAEVVRRWREEEGERPTTSTDKQAEIAALERMYALQSPKRPAIIRVLRAILRVLDMALTILWVVAVLYEELAVNLFPVGRTRRS